MDDGVPPLSDWQDVQVRVFPRPQVDSITLLPGGEFALAFDTIPGKTYRVDYKNALSEAEWVSLDLPRVATTGRLTVLDELTDQPQRFYRITLLD
jgi:hypothetical protein